jgi:fatty-acyl-CoA synthase
MMDRIFSVDWIGHHATTSPSNVACEDVQSGRHFTYAEFDDRIARLTRSFVAALDLSPGDRVLVLSRNDTDIFEIQFACQRTDTIFVPLNWRLSVAELEAIAKDAEANVLFYGSKFRSVAEQISSSIPRAVEMKSGRKSEYEDLMKFDPLREPKRARRETDIWALLYTSGTTGVPKGVQITYGMALCNAIVSSSAFQVGADSRNLVVLPLFHTGGLNVFANPSFFCGGANLVVRDFDAAAVLGLLASAHVRVTHMLGVPSIHAMLMAEPGFEQLNSASLHGLCVAGAPCPVSTIERYAALGLSLRQFWGMTEVGPLALITPHKMPAQRYGSSGIPSMFARASLIDKSGNAVKQGETGELVVRGPVVTPGYWRRPDATTAAFTSSGWFLTGDAAYRDDDGYFFIVDRWKDMFISGGENVYPAEVERILGLLREDVAECAVVGVEDAKWGEVGRAFIVRTESSDMSPEALRAHCEAHLARYKIPKEFVFVNALPRNSTGKVVKVRLREWNQN